MAILKANSTLGSNNIFTTSSSTNYRGNSFVYSLQAETIPSGFSVFKHANGVIQYGYITGFVGPQQGDLYGYVTGGMTPQPFPNAPFATNSISRFPFAAETVPATSLSGTLTSARTLGGNFSSQTDGYTLGGATVASTPPAPPKIIYSVATATSDKVPISSGGPAVSVSSTLTRFSYAAGNVADTTKGYLIGGNNTDYPHPYALYNDIYSYNLATDSLIADIGDTSPSPSRLTSMGSTTSGTDGYILGGQTFDYPAPNGGTPPPASPFNTTSYSNIKKFPFSSNSPATSIGNLEKTIAGGSGISAAFYGYSVGGTTTPSPTIPYASNSSNFYKFPFASITPITQVGSLTDLKFNTQYHQSSTRGYIQGDSFSFASDTPSVATITTYSPPTSPTYGASFSR